MDNNTITQLTLRFEEDKTDWAADIAEMHAKYKTNEAVRKLSPEHLREFIYFRLNFLEEELAEGWKAHSEYNHDDLVDSLIDLIVVSLGTLNALDVNPYLAWNRVFKANMAKEVGVKSSRPNKLGLPDLVKPKNWQAPTHADNIGLLAKVI